MGDEVVLLDGHVSPFGMRVRIALAEKGVKYEYKEQDMANKTPLLLASNPIHKQIPVLIHNAKPICESLIIVEYIDEVWNHDSPLLPSHPYQRAHVRFWANFVDQKLVGATRKVGYAGGEEQEIGKKELLEALKVLEGELGEKAYFGGDEFGFIDLAFIVFSTWFDLYESLGKFSIEEKFPKLIEWVKRCVEKQSVSKSLADRKTVHEFVMGKRKQLGLQ